jgi:hypothetical protein
MKEKKKLNRAVHGFRAAPHRTVEDGPSVLRGSKQVGTSPQGEQTSWNETACGYYAASLGSGSFPEQMS